MKTDLDLASCLIVRLIARNITGYYVLLTNLSRSRWLDIGQVSFLFFFCVFMDRDGVEIHKLSTPAFSVTCIGDIFVHLSTCLRHAIFRQAM